MNGIDDLTDDPDGWDDLFAAAPRPALEQSRAFGDALARTAPVTVERCVVRRGGQRIALVQAFRRRLIAGISVVRVVRGPVWLAGPGPDDIDAVLQLVRENWRWRSGEILSFVPDLPDGHESDIALRSAGFRRMVTGYSTVWLDLAAPLEALRRNLDVKWRNALVKAEDSGLRVRVSSSGDILHDVASRYDAFRKERRFSGPDGGLVRALAQKDGAVTVLSAHRGDALVAGIALARHGRAATYYISWTGEAGRAANAHNLLLWRAMETLRASGVRWFDLGGVDAAHAPGVARFKLGLGGEPTTLAGSYL